MDRQKFSRLLIQLRKEKNLTQQDFAELFNVSFQAVSKWEKGDSIPDITTLEKISQFYGIPINYLINGEVEEKQPSVSELIKRRRFKLIWCSLFSFLSILALFSPIFLHDDITVYFFELFILHTYKEFSFMAVLAWISQFAATIIGITSVFIYKNKKLILIEEALSLFSVLNIFSFLITIYNTFSGITFTYIMLVIIGIYILYWLMILFSDTLKFKIKLENPMQENYTRGTFILNCILFNIIIITIGFHYAEWIFSLLSLICSINALVVYIIMFKHNGKIFNIMYYVFNGISFGSLTILQIMNFSFSNAPVLGLVTILCIDLIYILYEVNLNKQNKKAKNTIIITLK